MQCKTIPNLIELDSYDGDYEQYENAVYNAYKITFENNQFYFKGKRIAHKKHPLYKDKSGTFWHIISNGPQEETRLPDLRRYERIQWPAYILGFCQLNCDKLLIWENCRNRKNRVVLWCQQIDYVVILDQRADYYIFWTAYPVTYSHTRKKLLKEYNNYISNNSII